jgi:hypothetical protein
MQTPQSRFSYINTLIARLHGGSASQSTPDSVDLLLGAVKSYLSSIVSSFSLEIQCRAQLDGRTDANNIRECRTAFAIA